MCCQAINLWTFTELVSAYLDLGIAFLLLVASTLAYSTSKFLGLFGLDLPCPCDGLFGSYNRDDCVQRMLVYSPSKRISLVQSSVTNKSPFNSLRVQDVNGKTNLTLEKGRTDGDFEFEGEASWNSFPQKRLRETSKEHSVLKNEKDNNVIDFLDVEEDKSAFELNDVGIQTSRHNLRYRHKDVAGSGKLSPVFYRESYALVGPHSSFRFGADAFQNDREASTDISLQGADACNFRSNEQTEVRPVEHGELSIEEFRYHSKGLDGFASNEKKMITMLEEALKEQHDARVALNIELEKERSAAATAAEEAMAMILRLQEEKASIEMEARQYQRMVEEKSVYDAEEMNILKEIILRREREKHFLEKEVEAYRTVVFGTDQSRTDMGDIVPAKISDDPLLLLQQQLGKAASEKQELKVADSSSYENVISLGVDRYNESLGKQPQIPGNEISQNIQEKGISFGGVTIFAEQKECEIVGPSLEEKSSSSQDIDPNSKTTFYINEETQHSDEIKLQEGFASQTTEMCNETGNMVPWNGDHMDKQKKEAEQGRNSSVFDAETCVHDVHVVDDVSDMHNEVSINETEQLSVCPSLSMPTRCESPTVTWSVNDIDFNRSSLDIAGGLPPRGRLRGKALMSDLRRNSMSAVDYERLRIDNEVGWLRERLRIVQQGREKLKLSVEQKKRDNMQLQVLENIASELRETRQLTQHGNSESEAFQLPPYSKVMSNKRQWRSMSLEVESST